MTRQSKIIQLRPKNEAMHIRYNVDLLSKITLNYRQIAQLFDRLQTMGAVPRLIIDSTVPGVICPTYIKSRYQQRLVIDLYPEDRASTFVDKIGVHADLQFDGTPHRCTFPLNSLRHIAAMGPRRVQITKPKTARPQLRVINGGKS